MKLFLLLLLVGTGYCLDKEQIKGLKALLKNLDGAFATCQLVLFSELVDYDTAEQKCQNFDIGTGSGTGNLATVSDEDKNTDLKLLLGMAYDVKEDKSGRWDPDQWVWAGLRKTTNNDGSQISRTYNAEDWEWADGANPNDFKKWMKGQPDQRKDGDNLQNQMRISHHGEWDDTFKYKKHPYACDYQGKYILSSSLSSWSQAKAACEKAGLQLAKVRSDQEVTEMMAAANSFLGLRDESLKTWNPSNWIWLGGSDAAEEGVWKWVDGSPIDYFDGMDWRPPNPDNADFLGGEDGQHFLALSRWGKFDDSFDSKKKQRPFACQCPGT
ncbi:uncharacterized protein LOC134817716 [Bolinopsis microptera]|uniref:uncharacterized protein LOC134817716 n=1 Tax=Bolinopsis microptera TaxID=2820187 RepID=UPI003079B264